MKDIFYLEGQKPPAEIAQNPRCMAVVVAWLLTAEHTVNEDSWIIDLCRHIGVDSTYATDVICSGFAACYKHLGDIQVTESVIVYLAKAEKALLQLVANPDTEHAAALRLLPALMQHEQSDKRQKGQNFSQLLFEQVVAAALPDRWLDELGNKQCRFFFSETEVDAKELAEYWQLLPDTLLPESRQSAAAIEALLVISTHALARRDAENAAVFETVAQSFIDTLTD